MRSLRFFTFGLTSRFRYTILVIVGIALGVACALSVDLIKNSVSKDVKRRHNPNFYDAPFALLTLGAPMNETAVYEFLDGLDFEVGFSGYLNQSAWMTLGDEKKQVTVVGVDLLAGSQNKDRARTRIDFHRTDLEFMNSRSAVALSADLRRHGSSPMQIFGAHGLQSLSYDGDVQAESDLLETAVFYLPTLQQHLNLEARLDGVFIWPRQGMSDDALYQRLQPLLPAGLELRRIDEMGTDYESLLASFHKALISIQWLALFMSLFVTTNAMSFYFRKREQEFAIMRCLGFRRARMLTLTLFEGLALGGIGSLLGLGLGVLIALASMDLVVQLVSSTYVEVRPVVEWRQPMPYLMALGSGSLAAMLGSLFPAWVLLRADPIRDLHPRARLELPRRFLGLARLACLILLGLEVLVFLLDLPVLIKGAAAIFLLYFILLLSFPFLSRLLQFSCDRWGGTAGFPWQLALRNLGRNPGRTLLTICSLSVGILLSLVILVTVASFDRSFQAWLEGLKAEFLVSLGSPISGSTLSSVPYETKALFEHLPGVKGVLGFKKTNTKVIHGSDRLVQLIRYEYDSYGKVYDMYPPTAGDAGACAQEMVHSNGVSISEALAFKENLRLGSVFSIASPKGPVEVQVCAIVVNYGSENGLVNIDRHLYARYWPDEQVNFFDIFLEDGVDRPAFQQTLQTQLDGRGLYISTRAAFHQMMTRILRSSFHLTYAGLLAAFVVAFLNFVFTIWVFALDRSREYSIMRALGIPLNQVGRSLAYEGAFICLFACLVGAGAGAAASWFVTNYSIKATQGWSLMLSVPTASILMLIAAVLILSYLAASLIVRRVLAPLNIHASLTRDS